MIRNCNKVKHTCGSPTMAECTSFEGTPNAQSPLVATPCLSIEDTSQDHYNQLGDIWTQIDLSALGNKCLEYVEVGGKVFVKNALIKMEDEICTLKAKVTALENRQLCDFPITSCVTDFGCLALPCDTTIQTLGDWIKAVQTKICIP